MVPHRSLCTSSASCSSSKDSSHSPPPRLGIMARRRGCHCCRPVREAALEQVEHRRDRRRRTGRGAEQTRDRAVGGRDELGAELQHAALLLVLLDDLDALAGRDELPVARVGARHERAQRAQAVRVVRGDLADQVLHQVEVLHADGEHRDDVARPDRTQQVGPGAVLEELHAPAGVRAEHERGAAVDDPGVEVRHRHRGSADVRLAVHLRLVRRDDRRGWWCAGTAR